MGDATRAVEATDIEQITGYARALNVQPPPLRRLPVNRGLGGLVSGIAFGRDPGSVFLHGGQLNAHTWDGTILRTGAAAIAYDLPGHGHSLRLAADGYTTKAIAELVTTRILADTEHDIVLVGHSYGAMVGAVVAATLGRRVKTLIILDATPHRIGTAEDDPETTLVGTLDQLVDSVHARVPQRRRDSVLRGVNLNIRCREDGLREWLWDPNFRKSSPLRRGEQDSIWSALTSLDIPITLVVGERSGKVTKAMVDDFTERLPRAETLVAPGAGHNVHNDAPAWMAALLAARLASRPG